MSKTKPFPNSLEQIPDTLTKDQKATFFDLFWEVWASNGFGTLPKRDTDLLIFDCLRRAISSDTIQSNHTWATLLRMTPARYKSMRLESHLRFAPPDSNQDDQQHSLLLKGLSSVQHVDVQSLASDGSIDSVKISFVVEDPVVQMELDCILKSSGTYLDYHRNREVVKIRLVDFCLIVSPETESAAINEWIKKMSEEPGDDLLKRIEASKYAKKSELGKLVSFADDLAKFAKVDTLTNHLKTIFKSQSERKK